MNKPCPNKIEPHAMDNNALSENMVTMGNIRVAMVSADDKMAQAKQQIQGAFTALTHHGQNKMDTRSLTVEHLKYALQELEFIPHKQLMLDIRILLATLERDIKEEKKK